MAETGLKKLHKLEPSVILIDINLSGMGALEVSQQIRDHSNFSHIPLIGVTAATVPADKAQAASSSLSQQAY